MHSWVHGKQEVLLTKSGCSVWCQLDNKILEGFVRLVLVDFCSSEKQQMFVSEHTVTEETDKIIHQKWAFTAAVLLQTVVSETDQERLMSQSTFLDKYRLKTDSFHVISSSLTSIQYNRRLAFRFIPQSHYSTFLFFPALPFSLNRQR